MLKLTKNSELLMSFFLEKKCINHSEQTAKTNNILKQLYHDIKQGETFVKAQKAKEGNSFYKLNVTKITNVSQIPKPKSFNPGSFPPEIRDHIDSNMLYNLSYTFSLMEREIKVHLLLNRLALSIRLRFIMNTLRKFLSGCML